MLDLRPCLLNQRIINKICFWRGVEVKEVINCCHKHPQWTLLLVSTQLGGLVAFKHFFNKKDWDAGMEATTTTSINSPLCNTISIYQLVFATARSNGRLSSSIICAIHLLICLLCFSPRCEEEFNVDAPRRVGPTYLRDVCEYE